MSIEKNNGRSLGKLFSSVYLEQPEPSEDSERFRLQLLAILDQLIQPGELDNLANAIQWNLGVKIPPYRHEKWFTSCPTRDLLDAITVITEFIVGKERKAFWINEIQSFFDQHNLKYELDPAGGVHYRIDAAFQHSKELTLACLRGASYAAASEELQKSFQYLTRVTADTKMAVVNAFLAAENVFKLVTESNGNLSSKKVNEFLTPLVQKQYANTDQATKQAAASLVQSFAKWVDSCHPYRHGQQDTDATAPTEEIAISLVTLGTDFIRWLVALSSQPEQAA